MSRPAILVIGPYPPGDIELLEAQYEVHRLWEADDQAAFLKQHGPSIRAIATRGDLGAPAGLVAALPNLEMIGVYGVGVDGIAFTATRPRGIKVANTPDVLTEDVADLALALMLGIARHIPQSDRFLRSGAWNEGKTMPLMPCLQGKRAGIVGLGRIGKAVARRCEAFRMPISYFGRTRQEGVSYPFFNKLTDLAANSDYLIATVAGGAGSAGIVNAEVLKALGPKGFFINVARGSVADEPALLDALEGKTIAGAALDVYMNEPRIDPRFAKLENVVLLPHIGSATIETRRAMGQLMRDNIAAHFAGKPLLTPVP
jgi:lactate dehydrogenase-like 2-hydroxyacid dehydrogenase